MALDFDPHAGDDDPQLLDRIDALRVLRADSPEEKGRLLEEIGGPGRAEQDIVDQLSKIKPLWDPDRFPEAHRMAMRSLEVLDRNGVRGAPMPRPLGPLRPVAGFVVQLVTRWIVRDHQNKLASDIRKLYERREANSIWGSPAHVALRRARINAVQVEHGLKSNPIGVPGFLLGGAVLSGLFSAIADGLSRAITSGTGRLVFGIVVALLMLSLSWVAIYAASIARRRIRLTTQQPVGALWDTIGAAGDPPRDHSYHFALVALILLAVAALAIPLVASALL
ncbi:MAG: hypothetical protein R8G01_06000 [Ilumatobacteraceae bacterium]|nr:hypothetical protein [Ilumatobacteraceae bacterium]